MLRRVLLVAAVVLAGATTAVAQPAPPTTAPPTTVAESPGPTTTVPASEPSATVAVTPSSGLTEGQVVEVSGSGYPANQGPIRLWLCFAGFTIGGPFDAAESCAPVDDDGVSLAVSGGELSGTWIAQQTVEVGRGRRVLDCGLPEGCEVIVYDAAYEVFIQDGSLPRSLYEVPGARQGADRGRDRAIGAPDR